MKIIMSDVYETKAKALFSQMMQEFREKGTLDTAKNHKVLVLLNKARYMREAGK